MKKTKGVQYFTDDYLESCKAMKPEQIVQFLDDFRKLHAHVNVKPEKSKLISIKVPEDLLRHFKAKANLNGVAYQTQIKKLMMDWLTSTTKTTPTSAHFD